MREKTRRKLIYSAGDNVVEKQGQRKEQRIDNKQRYKADLLVFVGIFYVKTNILQTLFWYIIFCKEP